MKRAYLFLLVIVLVAAATAISLKFIFPYQPDQPPTADSTGFTQDGIQQVVGANNKFAFDLYYSLNSSENENVFYSPYSISTALAMTYEGAKGKTADEIKSVFHYPEASTLRPNSAAIYNDINNKNGEYTLRTGNALWLQKDFPLLPDYTSNVEKYYGGNATNLDFISATEESRQTINTFIEDQTNGKIKDLISKDILGADTRLVLTNAIYFKGTWQWEFDKSDTRDLDFKTSPTQFVKAPTMYMKPDKALFNYADLDDLQILELPYKGNKLSMLIILPNESVDNIQLSAEKLKEWKSQMHETKLDAIYLPKFEFNTKYSMAKTLISMGMPTAFDAGSADFSGMDGRQDLFISAVIHQAFVSVDEKGTEAAAATAVVMTMTAVMERNVFRADHPFIFIIQDKETGNILFMGKVADPTK